MADKVIITAEKMRNFVKKSGKVNEKSVCMVQ